MTQKHNPPWSLEPGARASPVWATHTGQLGQVLSGTTGGGRAFVLWAYAGSQEVAQGTSTHVGRVEGE